MNFTTTPELRDGISAPYTDPILQVNLVLRVAFGTLAIVVCFGPLMLLRKNGEFAAAVFCALITLLNLLYTINALIWRDNNVADWYGGYGWCDLQVYTFYPLQLVYSGCVLEIMRSLAAKLGLSRAVSLSKAERRREVLVSSAVIFVPAVVQMALTFLVLARRYNITTLVGCTALYDLSWPYLVFFVLPVPLYTVAAAVMAVLVWKRFRRFEKATHTALHFNNNGIAVRQRRVRRKLYFMALAILLPYLPLQMIFLFYNIAPVTSWTRPYNFTAIHYGEPPFRYDFISFTTSDRAAFVDMNINYMSVLSAVPVFIMFGTTQEAIHQYCKYLCALGLGALFPKLRKASTSSASPSQQASWVSESGRRSDGFESMWTGPVRKQSMTFSTADDGTRSSGLSNFCEADDAGFSTMPFNLEAGSSARANRQTSQPWRDPAADAVSPSANTSVAYQPTESTHLNRNPWLFRTILSHPLRFPALPLPSCRNLFRKPLRPRQNVCNEEEAPIAPPPRKRTPTDFWPLPSLPLDPSPVTIRSDRGVHTGPWIGKRPRAGRVHICVWSRGKVRAASSVATLPPQGTDAGIMVETRITSVEESRKRAVDDLSDEVSDLVV